MGEGQLAPGPVEMGEGQLAPGPVEIPDPPARLAPVAPARYALQLTIGKATHDKLRYAQALLSHQIPAGEVAEVLDRALDALIGQLERRKFAATSRPRPRSPHVSENPRHIPAEVRRAVWERDGGQCTFVSEAGHRCPARSQLEYDHVEPVARRGRATVEGMRLRCRAHNQFGAERIFGAGFMHQKREQARAAAAARAKAAKLARAATAERGKAEAAERTKAMAAERAKAEAAAEVIPWLQALGYRAGEARQAAEARGSDPAATLEQRLRAALSCLVRSRCSRAA